MQTVQEIIGAAIAADRRDEFRALCIKQAEMHDDYARLNVCSDVRARQGAIAQKNACLHAYDYAAAGDLEAICATLGTCVIALNIAGKMLGVSPAARTAAIVAWEAARNT